MSELPQVGQKYHHKDHGQVFVVEVRKSGRGYSVHYDYETLGHSFNNKDRLKDFQKATK